MGRPVNPHDIVRVERITGTRPLRMQALVTPEFTYKVETVEDGSKTMSLKVLKPILEEVASKQEPEATKSRHQELVSRLIDRTWNSPVLYLNRKTGEVFA